MRAVGYGDEHGPPISASFIYRKETGLLATRSEILSSMANSNLAWPDIDPPNQPIYGLELSVGMDFDELTKESVGRAVVDEFRKTAFGKALRERTTVSREWEGYGCTSAILYLPATKEEELDVIPKDLAFPDSKPF